MATLISRARTVYSKHPLVTNVVMYAALYGSGDLSRQTIQRTNKYDLDSAGKMAIIGGSIFGPLYHVWYQRLDKFLPGNAPKIIVKKIICDQTLGLGLVAVFYICLSILDRKEDIFKDAKEKGPKTYLTGCIYWPTVQAINFAFLPSHLRTTYVGVNAFIWTNILSYFKDSGNKEEGKLEADLLVQPETV